MRVWLIRSALALVLRQHLWVLDLDGTFLEVHGDLLEILRGPDQRFVDLAARLTTQPPRALGLLPIIVGGVHA
jgi:hypothetical protein